MPPKDKDESNKVQHPPLDLPTLRHIYNNSMAHYRDINKLLITPFVWKQETFLEHFKGLGNAAISGISTIIINLKHSIDERKNDAFNKITGTNLDELKEIYEDLDYKILVSIS